jgi:site-specific DNA-cytosine methylase
LKILVACEESQAVTIRLRALGHEAYSCDIMECSGGHPEWHLQQDVTEVLKEKWDMIIAFPPCTHLAVSGAAWFEEKRKDGRQQQGIDFFMMFANHECQKVAIENPVGIMSTKWRKPDQIIQPYQFGHTESKKTCLWLKGLPKLSPTKILTIPACGHWDNTTKDGNNKIIIDGKWISYKDPRTAIIRSKTYPGIADAMAQQWSNA